MKLQWSQPTGTGGLKTLRVMMVIPQLLIKAILTENGLRYIHGYAFFVDGNLQNHLAILINLRSTRVTVLGLSVCLTFKTSAQQGLGGKSL